MNNGIRYDVYDLQKLDQMHDETIHKILIKDEKLILKFDELHYSHNGGNFQKAELVFCGFEDICCDAYMDIVKAKNCRIKNGKRFYIDEFIDRMKRTELTLEVIDILLGYGKIVIFGNVFKKLKRSAQFCLTIHAKEVAYLFY